MMQSTMPSSYPLSLIEYEVIPVAINWAAICQDIHERGMPYSQQALAIGKGWSSMQKWLAGSQPQTPTGLALLFLHTRICGQETTLQRLREATLLD